MSTASSVGLILSGIMIGVFLGVGGIYMDLIPNPQAQVLEVRLENSGEEIDELAGEVIDLQEELSQKSSQLLSVESSIGKLEEEIVENEAMLNQVEVERDTLLEEISQKELELASQLTQIIDLGQSNEALQVQLDSLSTVIEERANLLNEVSGLNQQIVSLTSRINTMVSQTNSLSFQLVSLQLDYDELRTKWDLWKEHSDYAPQSRPEFDWIGFIPSPGNYNLDQTSFLISFQDPSNCLILFGVAGTGSMRPAFGGGHEVIETTCFDVADLRVGDIITYQPPGGGLTVTHQIIEVRSDGVITKGINNEVADPVFIELEGDIVRWEDIVGLVIAIIY